MSHIDIHNVADEHIDEKLTPAPATTTSQSEITKEPILIIAGLSHNSLRLCLETVLRQPGIKPYMVLVTYDENYEESGALATLFCMAHTAINASASYMAQYTKAVDIAWTHFKDAVGLCYICDGCILAARDDCHRRGA